MHKGSPELHKPAGSLPLAKLVECLQKLGGVGEAQLTFRRHMPTQASQHHALTHPCCSIPSLPVSASCHCTGSE